MDDGLRCRKRKQVPSDGRPRIESDDLLVEILSRLPVRSLVRFRCVCKSWRALISDSHLVMKHLSCSVSGVKSSGCCSRLIFSTVPLQSLDYAALNDAVGPVARSELCLPGPLGCMRIVGSCNGLVCLEGNRGCVVLWNPSTRETRVLPVLNILHLGIMFYGFGYDSTIDDYKVILGLKSVAASTTTVAIFTLKTGLWRAVHAGGYVKLNGQGCLINGALHWVEMKWAETVVIHPVLSSRIMSFGLAEETFQELMPLSYLTKDQIYTSARIGNTGNCLFVYLYSDNAITIWVMKEYRVMDSWTKVIHVPEVSLSRFPPRLGPLAFLNPICILENSEVLMNFNGLDLVLYNPNERAFRNALETPAYLAHEPAMYVESLVSPITGKGTIS
ncbi:hypothetical protein M0R45_034961 [Rubus argutus]|uniref:F-box domain-containing protein n=1 Tax=Rubus argutus TaxID=59490 RepID=A0AAW1VX35_RUBAR